MHIASSAGGNTITFELSGMSGENLSDFMLTYAVANAGGTARTQSWAYSTTGTAGSFSTTGVTQPGGIAANAAFAADTVDFSGANATLASRCTIYFRLTLAGRDYRCKLRQLCRYCRS